MAFLVLVFGCLMALAGAYEIYVGNSIISVERGWSAFISGSVFLAGGLITVAIGLLIRALNDLRFSPAAESAEATTDRSEPAMPLDPASDPVRPPPLASELRPALERDWSDGGHHVPVLDAAAAPQPDDNGSIEPADAHATYAETASPLPHEHAPPLRPSLDTDLPEAPAMDDWLERSFADLDRDSARDAARAAATRVQPTHDELSRAGITHAEALHTEAAGVEQPDPDPVTSAGSSERADSRPTPARSNDRDVEQEPAASDSPVIGRYEADGTSYVMYADGSIEAQSAAGIYRFASMAELKTFIET